MAVEDALPSWDLFSRLDALGRERVERGFHLYLETYCEDRGPEWVRLELNGAVLGQVVGAAKFLNEGQLNARQMDLNFSPDDIDPSFASSFNWYMKVDRADFWFVGTPKDNRSQAVSMQVSLAELAQALNTPEEEHLDLEAIKSLLSWRGGALLGASNDIDRLIELVEDHDPTVRVRHNENVMRASLASSADAGESAAAKTPRLRL